MPHLLWSFSQQLKRLGEADKRPLMHDDDPIMKHRRKLLESIPGSERKHLRYCWFYIGSEGPLRPCQDTVRRFAGLTPRR